MIYAQADVELRDFHVVSHKGREVRHGVIEQSQPACRTEWYRRGRFTQQHCGGINKCLCRWIAIEHPDVVAPGGERRQIELVHAETATGVDRHRVIVSRLRGTLVFADVKLKRFRTWRDDVEANGQVRRVHRDIT